MREFLRGGYKHLEETTVVSNHGRPVFTVFPFRVESIYPGDVDTSPRDPVVIRSAAGDGATAPPRSAGVPEA